MAKIPINLRIAKKQSGYPEKMYKVEVGEKANMTPLKDSSGRVLPTIFVALDLEIPDIVFTPQVINVKVQVQQEKIIGLAEVKAPGKVLEMHQAEEKPADVSSQSENKEAN